MHHLYVLLARIALSLVLAADGWERLAAGGSGLALLMPALQLLASAALLAGAWSRTAALLLAALVLVPALALLDMAGPEQVLWLGWSLLLGGGLVLLAAQGAGDFSFDAWRRDRADRSNDTHMTPGGAL
ncbi:DoxX family protein [Pseudoxanthomonas suwonensis 11-1]|uniref:DoxX family protein n=1 Tax=Pseudoxanthomonas suwonensis (strain 11-1) TaxID=743721 RepID=E6WWP9_PSEUU|nr:hypothetical protein [Pseudoxanthomonas suwonensis]ADV28598.1 DoxX family protein [Pseudoxanthomonas suwonensis 11-1]